MTREFIRTNEFEKRCKSLGLSEDNIRELESFLCLYPEAGDLIQGTGGLRKLRWSLPDTGKSGGIRVVYVDFAFYEKIYFISAYSKSEKVNLSKEACNQIKKYIKLLNDEIRKK
ncbi:Addiction module toxin RelE [Petrocella atlantisensis]|uniref:Addiction module toxin RelE n=1 Tax=Petrocella atlantisensis TaxID=2173034 RepID=A0A3P7S6U7_9FIRM|nr:type II toxin-antitoxin system RelE/ParE family toxin [Petrocella atlantisensis]VDN47989.1 Addiction module toxin RelE [Petrocella atlantisensis]